ncbi:MAG TPA: hypothetical protein VN929_06445 [Burkholderiales bacterium]|nr:hypothetical protein [Burkholderiales bacterium]
MKSIIVALSLATFTALALAAQPQRTNDAGEPESDFDIKTHRASTGNTYYRNQAGEEDKHQPQVGG